MLKYIVVLFALVAAAAAQDCMQYACVANGEDCSDGWDLCASGNFCDQVSNLCSNMCTSDAECSWGMDCNTDGECVPTGYLQGGEACDNSNQCLGSLTCDSGSCTLNVVGDSCSIDWDCQYGLYCNASSECDTYAADGEACDYTGAGKNCEAGLACIMDVCAAEYSIATGGNCTDSTFNACEVGSYCFLGECTAFPPTTPTPTPEWGNACDNSTECEGSYMCYCNYVTGEKECNVAPVSYTTVGLTECSDEYDAAVTCQMDAECWIMSTYADSCFADACACELEQWSDCVSEAAGLDAATTTCAGLDAFDGSCPQPSAAPGDDSPGDAASTVVASVVLILAALAVLF